MRLERKLGNAVLVLSLSSDGFRLALESTRHFEGLTGTDLDELYKVLSDLLHTALNFKRMLEG